MIMLMMRCCRTMLTSHQKHQTKFVITMTCKPALDSGPGGAAAASASAFNGRLKGVEVDSVNYYYGYGPALQECIRMGSKSKGVGLAQGKLVHAHMIQTGFRPSLNIYTGTKLIIMYVRCGSLNDARRVFDTMRRRNLVAWTTLIGGYARDGCSEEAWELYDAMQRAAVEPDEHVFSAILPACASRANLGRGLKLHVDILMRGYSTDVFIASALIDMYVKCGSLDDARQVFDKMMAPDSVAWTVMISGYTHCGLFEEGLRLYWDMRSNGINPSAFTLTPVLNACACIACLDSGMKVHKDVVKFGLTQDVYASNGLIDMYAKCATVEYARLVFDRMPLRNAVSWTSMIAGYVQNGYLSEAIRLFHKTEDRNETSWTAMISGYMQNGCVDEAVKLFDVMTNRDSVSWTAMITGFVQNGFGPEALELFAKMRLSYARPILETFAGILPVVSGLSSFNGMGMGMALHGLIVKSGVDSALSVGNALVEMYSRCRNLENAQKVFNGMNTEDVVSWNTLLSGYFQIGNFDSSLALFYKMPRNGVKPNSSTLSSVLAACASKASLCEGQCVHGYAIKIGLQDAIFVGSALIDMYSKCGNIQYAEMVFDQMPARDIVIWNAMIMGYAVHGHAKECIRLYDRLSSSDTQADEVTFLGLLSSCCHAGLVNDGRNYFDIMCNTCHIMPSLNHFGCMVNLLGRAGFFTETMDIINKMPMKPDITIWGSLLGSSVIHNNVEVGEYAAKWLFELDPQNASHYVALSNIYASANRFDDVDKIRNMMKARNVTMMPGFSYVKVNKKINVP